jgi:CubicO group peptidase (beta-lactamase class C family)
MEMNSITRRQFTKAALVSGLVALPLTSANAEPKSPLKLTEPLADIRLNITKKMPKWRKRYGVPAVSLVLIREGTPVWTQSYGFQEFELRQPVNDDTVFEAASMTKPIAAFVALTMWKEGRLDIDRPLAAYLDKEFQDAAPENFLRITARHALSHTSGLPDWRSGRKAPELAFKPGEDFLYSGEAFMFLQEVMQRITGESLEDLCRKRVFEPLNMDHSSLVWKKEYDAILAPGYGKKLRKGIKRKIPNPMAAASLISSPTDYAKFVAHVLQTSKQQTRGRLETIYRTMLTPQVDVQEGVSWGLGWGLQTCGDEEAFWHWGNNADKYHSFAIGYPKHGLGLVVMTNSGNGLTLCRELVPEILGGCHPAFDYNMVIT